MTLLDRAKEIGAVTGTVAMNFWPWLLAAFLLGGVASGYATFKITRAFYRGEALEAKLNLSKFTEQQATNAATGQAEARRLAAEAQGQFNAWQSNIENKIATGFGRLSRQISSDTTTLRESINAPVFDCLRLPYPADSLRLLSRPGGPIPAGDHQDPGAAAPAGGVP